MDLAEVRSQGNRKVKIHIDAQKWSPSQKEQLQSLLFNSEEEGCRLVINYQTSNAKCDLRLGKNWRINPDDENIQLLKRCFGDQNVNFV